MASSYLNIVLFLLTTLFYYLALKPSLPYTLYKNKEQYSSYISNSYMYLAIYIVLVILIQFMVNASIITTNCGGNISENIGQASVMTFLPWILIFGVLVLILSMYPGFKSAFSDVVGYFYVSSSANKLITDLLINTDIENKMGEETNMTPEKKKALETAADLIIKICGNKSILINQIVPDNFEEYWSILTPLMKDKYKAEGPDTEKIKNDLFEIVVTRDNVGEAMWYIYTGLLLTSIVQLKITTRGCKSSPQTMQANYKKFLQQEQQSQQAEQNASTTYTMAS